MILLFCVSVCCAIYSISYYSLPLHFSTLDEQVLFPNLRWAREVGALLIFVTSMTMGQCISNTMDNALPVLESGINETDCVYFIKTITRLCHYISLLIEEKILFSIQTHKKYSNI